MKNHSYLKQRPFLAVIVLLLLLFGFTFESYKRSSKDDTDLQSGFLNPPESAKPRVWWHWMNGNITKEGIKADLEWMHRVGIGGFQNFDASLMTPQVVEKRLVYMTPEWKDAFRYATKLADSLNLEMAIAGSPGWSESGGPWVKPAQAMKKYVWSETRVEGGKPFSGVLPKPSDVSGAFQNMTSSQLSLAKQMKEKFYSDAAVVAFRIPDNDVSMNDLQPKVTSSGGSFNLADITDGDLAKSTLLPAAPVNQISWVQFEFEKPETFEALSIVGGGFGGFFGAGKDPDNWTLEMSDDGNQYRIVTTIPSGGVGQKTLADLVAENHYDQLSNILHSRGMGRYSESHESGRAFISGRTCAR